MMKTTLLTALLAFFALTFQSYAQFSFGVSPGLGLNTAYFGYKINDKILPYAGFQYLNANIKYEESGERYDPATNEIVSYTETDKLTGSLYIPTLGVKYFIKQQDKIQAYLTLGVTKPILSGKTEYDGDEDSQFNEDLQNIDLWGGEFGFGVEYFFDPSFSLGGEFGIRYLRLRYKDSNETFVFDPSTGDTRASKFQEDYGINISPTYSKISLNYYFQRRIKDEG